MFSRAARDKFPDYFDSIFVYVKYGPNKERKYFLPT